MINLNDNTRQTFTTGDTPLAAAFVADGAAIVVTTTTILQFDPISGALNVLDTFAALATQKLPAKSATFPTQVILAQIETTPDRTAAFGVADDGKAQMFFKFDLKKGSVFAQGVRHFTQGLASAGCLGRWHLDDGRAIPDERNHPPRPQSIS